MVSDDLDPVFRALADPSRRLLLDRLAQVDGQTLAELCLHLPGMTRYGVMKHLGVLEAAHLVTTRRAGRNKHHYLNRVPIRQALDRWIEPILEPAVAGLSRLKNELETTTPPEGATR